MSIKVFVDGAAGTTGLEIVERLQGRPEYTLLTLDEAYRKDVRARGEAINEADFVILCLPDQAAREAVGMIRNRRTRVIDASTAHRVDPDWAYGFAEFAHTQRNKIKSARYVSNPGCYPTGFLSMIAPLVANKLLPGDHPYTVNAVSGVSGGGKELISRFDADPGIAFRTYALALVHKHQAEMRHHAGLAHAPLFAPSVIPAYRGMIVEVPLVLAAMENAAPVNELADALFSHYADEALVRVVTDMNTGELFLRNDAQPDDGMEIFVCASDHGALVRLICRLDNLGKGASGAAIQNLNIMAGVEELAGLRVTEAAPAA